MLKIKTVHGFFQSHVDGPGSPGRHFWYGTTECSKVMPGVFPSYRPVAMSQHYPLLPMVQSQCQPVEPSLASHHLPLGPPLANQLTAEVPSLIYLQARTAATTSIMNMHNAQIQLPSGTMFFCAHAPHEKL